MASRICLLGLLSLIAVMAHCAVSEDVRDNPRDPLYGTTGSGGVSSRPDLVVSVFNTSTNYTRNTNYNFSVTVKNQGNSAAGSFTVGVNTGFTSSSLNYALAYSGGFAGKTIVGSLAAGATTVVTVPYTPLFTSDGVIGAYVDTTETVTESNESNNYILNNVIINN